MPTSETLLPPPAAHDAEARRARRRRHCLLLLLAAEVLVFGFSRASDPAYRRGIVIETTVTPNHVVT